MNNNLCIFTLFFTLLLVIYFFTPKSFKERFEANKDDDIMETSIFSYQHDPMYRIIGVTKKTSMVYVFSNQDRLTVSFQDIKRIYYFSNASHPVITRIFKMYNADHDTKQLIQLEYENISKLQLDKYDIIITLLSPDDKMIDVFHTLYFESINCIRYTHLHFNFPLCSLKQFKLHIPNIIYTDKRSLRNNNYRHNIDLLKTQLFQKHYGLNTSENHKPFSKNTNRIADKDINIPSKYIMFTFDVDQDVHLIDSVNNIKQSIIVNRFLKPGDKVELTKQSLSENNGIYYVNRKLQDNRYIINNIYMVFPKILNNIIKLRTLPDNIFLFIGERIHQEDGIYSVDHIDDKLKVAYFMKHSKQERSKQEGRCIDENQVDIHTDYLNEYACTSQVDMIGLEKQKHHWVVKCTTDSDCPYFMANKNYKNYYGKCKNDFCQLPLGLKITDRYDMDTLLDQALCYGCIHNSNYTCCREQLDSNLYPHLSSPDYVYPNDTNIRYYNLSNNILNL